MERGRVDDRALKGGLVRLPTGDYVALSAIRAISAHENHEPFWRKGITYAANVRIETFQQVIVVSHIDMQSAEKHRDTLAELVNRTHERRFDRRRNTRHQTGDEWHGRSRSTSNTVPA